MDNNRNAVLGQPDVELDSVRAIVNGACERRDGVLRRNGRSASVAYD